MFARKPPAVFGSSAPYQNDQGQWKVMVTIDNANEVERDASAEEIAAASRASAPVAAPVSKPTKTATKKG